MKLVKTLLLLILLLLGGLYLGGMALSPRFHVERSVQIAASPDKIYPLVANPRHWKRWSVWNQRDPSMAIEYSGPESGSGAAWAWKSQREGDGKMTFTNAESPHRLGYELFFPDFGTISRGEFRIESSSPNNSRVSWSMDGDMGSNPLFRWIGLFSDKMVGADFEAGLAGLKALAEKS